MFAYHFIVEEQSKVCNHACTSETYKNIFGDSYVLSGIKGVLIKHVKVFISLNSIQIQIRNKKPKNQKSGWQVVNSRFSIS